MRLSRDIAIIILAGGKGTRMKSGKAKVLHEVFHRPMIHYVVEAVQPLKPSKTIVVVGHQRQLVARALNDYDVILAEQREQKGTGHAVLIAEPCLDGFEGDVMILCGDSPLLLPTHLLQMLQAHQSGDFELTIMTTTLEDPTNYGRIINDKSGRLLEIVEEKDADVEQRRIRTINAGIYCGAKSFFFKALKEVTPDNNQQEMYLTDIVAIGVKNGARLNTFAHPHPNHVLGVNSRNELAQAHVEIQARRNKALMDAGVTMHNPQTTSVDQHATLETDITLGPHVTISGNSSIKSGTVIEPGVVIRDCSIGAGAHIGAGSVLSRCTVAEATTLPPLTRINGGQGD